MHELEQHIQSNWHHLRSKTISIACSGGLDSMVLLHLLYKLEFKVNVLHINYKLRGEDSEKDEDFVRKCCHEKAIEFNIRQVHLNEELKLGGNLQEKARNFRYHWFHEILDKSESNRVALGHHADDQVETFFMNIARKSGIMGLACMPEERDGIVRPLLNFTKETLKSYAIENGIKWREDTSNSSLKYRRNLLRNEILPFASKAIPTLHESALTLIQKFQSTQIELEEEVKPLYENILESHVLSMQQFKAISDFAKIELFRMLDQPHGIASEVQRLNQKGSKVMLLPSTNHLFSAVVFDEIQLSFIASDSSPIPKLMLIKIDALPEVFVKNEIYLDPKKIEGELTLRRWRIGDRIAPIGIKGTRLISDIISDAKLTAIQKKDVLVVHDKKHIHWCVNLCIGREAIASVNTQKIKVYLNY